MQFKPWLLYGVMSLHVGRWYKKELIRHLKRLILSPQGWHATLFSPTNSGEGAILDADYPSMRQVDMVYNVTSSRITPDLTFIIIPWYKSTEVFLLTSLLPVVHDDLISWIMFCCTSTQIFKIISTVSTKGQTHYARMTQRQHS